MIGYEHADYTHNNEGEGRKTRLLFIGEDRENTHEQCEGKNDCEKFEHIDHP